MEVRRSHRCILPPPYHYDGVKSNRLAIVPIRSGIIETQLALKSMLLRYAYKHSARPQ